MSKIAAATLSALIVFGGLALSPSFVFAEKLTKTVELEIPDIHEDFCGAKIDFKICKCARHGQMCKDISRTREVAAFILNARFKAYVATLRATFAATCVAGGGKFQSDSCQYFEKTDKENKCLPDDFDRNWQKYSDIDPAIPPAERSFEARNFYETGEKLKDVLAGLYILERDIELNRLMLAELKEYRKAVGTNLKTNLLKSFWRLAWLTYDTAAGAAAPMRFGSEGTFLFQGGTDLGRSFAKLFDDDTLGIQQMAVLAKLARESMGDSSKYTFDTKTLDGKVGSVSMTTLIAFFESYGNPVETAKEMFQDITKQALPDVAVKLSQEDFDLLANHYNKTKTLDNALQEGSRKRANMELIRDSLLKDKERLTAEFAQWEEKEHTRIQELLVSDCKK